MRRRLTGRTIGTIAGLIILGGLAGCTPGEASGDPSNPMLDELSSDDAASFKEGLDALAEYYGVDDPPEISIVRWIMPEEATLVHRSCLEDAGYPFVDGAFTQDENFGPAMYRCVAMYPVEPRYTAPWEDEQISIQYDWTVEWVIPCLEEQGFAVGSAPSRAVFVDTWASAPFFPFAQLPATLSNDEFDALEQQCPQIAPGRVLFDGLEIDEWEPSSTGELG